MAEETCSVFVEDINNPSDMFRGDDLKSDESESDPHRFVVPYGTNPGLDLGIEDVNSVITPIKEHQNMWYPLETVLTKWIELIRAGKVTTKIDAYNSGIMPEEIGSTPQGTISDNMTQTRTIQTKNQKPISLIQMLTPSRRPGSGIRTGRHRQPPPSPPSIVWHKPSKAACRPGPPHTGSALPLLSLKALDAARVPEESFVRSFLTLARWPCFTRIAPGLTIAGNVNVEAFSRMQRLTPLQEAVEKALDHLAGTVVPPVLVLPAAQDVNGRARTTVPSDKWSKVSSGSWTRYLPHLDQAIILASVYKLAKIAMNLGPRSTGPASDPENLCARASKLLSTFPRAE